MNQQSSGKGSAIRLVVLILLLGLLGYSFYNDINIKGPASDEAAMRIMELSDTPGQTTADVEKAAGMKAARTFKVDKFQVEEYRYPRTIPFLKLRSVYAVYEGEELFKVIDGVEPTIDTIKGKNSGLTVDFKTPKGPLPVPSMSGGGPAPSGDDKKAGKKEGDDKAEGEKKDGDSSANDAGKAADSKNENAAPPTEKQEDKKSDDTSGGQPADGEKKGDEGKGG